MKNFEQFIEKAILHITYLSSIGFEIKNAVIDSWRGVRIIIDCAETQNCKNTCSSCKVYKTLGQHPNDFDYTKEPDKLHKPLFFWTDEKDIELYGPERFLQCKTLERYQQCFINCVLYDPDMHDRTNLLEEIRLIRDFEIIKSTKKAQSNLSLKTKRRIIEEILKDIEHERMEMLHECLKESGWDFVNIFFN